MIDSLENLSKEQLINEVVNHKSEINYLKHQLEQYKKAIFGSKREKFVPAANPEQTTLDLDLPTDAIQQHETESVSYSRRKSKKKNTPHPGRMEFSSELPVEEIVIEPAEDVSGMKKIGEEVTTELEITPAVFIVKKYIRPKYAKQDAAEEEKLVVIAPMPHRPIYKGIAGPGLLATVITDKYVDHLPIYRQVKRYERMGVKLNENTISEWIQKTCDLIEPLYNFLRSEVLKQKYLQVDETYMRVLDKNKKGKTHRGFYWAYHSPLTKQLFFDYQPGRGGEAPMQILKDFEGILQTDAYVVYDKFNRKGIELSNCMTHARRNFVEALDYDKKRAEFVLSKMQKLYEVEEYARENNFSLDQRLALRREKSVPVLEELKAWLTITISELRPTDLIRKACEYSLGRWERLCLYSKYGHLEIDNNLVENAIRPIALGRKNYLFAGSHEAARRAGMIYSFFAMCHANKINPHDWLKDTVYRIGITKPEDYQTLLPGFIQQ